VFMRMGRTRLKPLKQPTPEVGIEKMGHESQISPTFGMLSDQHASPSPERGIKALSKPDSGQVITGQKILRTSSNSSVQSLSTTSGLSLLHYLARCLLILKK